jgi:Xaa-Pro aminopeptidase
MILPILERPDAERAPSAGTIALTDWADGSDPHAAAAPLLDLAGTYAISDSAWALQLLGLQQACQGTRYVSMSTALPMLRAVKDADELERLAEAGEQLTPASRRS